MWALCLDRGDVYWCNAPPGSPAWPSLGMLAPWTAGATVLCVEVPVDADNWVDLVSRHGVSVAYVDADTAHKIAGTAPPSDDSPALRRLLLGAANDLLCRIMARRRPGRPVPAVLEPGGDWDRRSRRRRRTTETRPGRDASIGDRCEHTGRRHGPLACRRGRPPNAPARLAVDVLDILGRHRSLQLAL